MDGARALRWARFSGVNLDPCKTPHRGASEDNASRVSINVLLVFGFSPLEMENKERTREIHFFLILPFKQGPDHLAWPVSALSRARPYFTPNHRSLGEQCTTPWGTDGCPISQGPTGAAQT